MAGGFVLTMTVSDVNMYDISRQIDANLIVFLGRVFLKFEERVALVGKHRAEIDSKLYS